MQTFKVCYLGLVAVFDKYFKRSPDHSIRTTTEIYLLAEPVRLCLFLECGFYHSRPGATDAFCKFKGSLPSSPSRILVNCNNGRGTKSLQVNFSHALSRRFWCDHEHINIRRRFYPAPVDCSAVGKAERLT